MDWSRWQKRATKLFAHPRPLRFAASRGLWHSGLSRLFTTELSDGVKLRFYPSSISAALWVERESRSDDAQFLRDVLRPGDTYVDAGANIGHLAIIARKIVGADGTVTAIEASPRIFSYCVGNLALNGFGDVLAINAALGDKRGSIEISDRRDDDQNNVGAPGHVVAMRTLDEVCNIAATTLLKIDVEGFELQVLRGATRLLGSTQFVYCELSSGNSARFGYHPREAEQLLCDAGFLLGHRRGDEWRLSRTPIFDTLDAADQPSTGYNLLAVRRDCVDELTQRLRERHRTVVL